MRLASPILVGVIVGAIALAAAAAESVRDALRQRVAEAEERLQAAPADDEARQALAEALYFLATRGKEGKAAKRAEALFAQLHDRDPDAAQPVAYLGSLKLLRSSTTWAVWDKEKLARQGLAMLDQAVDAAPDDPEVRYIRAVTTFNLPDWFERGEQSASDLTRLAADAEEAVEAGTLEPWLAASAYYHHGQWRERKGDRAAARAAYEAASRVAPGSPAAADADQARVRLNP